MFRKWKVAAIGIVSTFVLLGFYTNCSAPKDKLATDSESSSGGSGPDLNASCAIVTDSTLRKPATIEDAVRLVQALPKPVSLNCFLKNLSGPLQVVAIDSINSAQPADGPENPRLFLINSPLILSVVPAGVGKYQLEFSQVQVSGATVKAELLFPIVSDFAADLPYTRILLNGGGGTSCKACHFNEYRALGYTAEAYGSDILRPRTTQLLDFNNVKNSALNCNSAADAYRCAILKAIFIDGQAQQGRFP